VQQAKFGHPGYADGGRAIGVCDWEPCHALRCARSDLAQSRTIRAFEWARLDAAMVGPPLDEDAGSKRRVAGPPSSGTMHVELSLAISSFL
jgi:hypothetical protein